MYLDRAKFITLFQGGSDLYRLFANGEDGFLFGNFGDLTRLFTTYDGQANVAVDADPVGLALDDSKWSKRTFAQQLGAQTDLIVNGDFASGSLSGWSFAAGSDVVPTYSGGRMSMARGAGAIGGHPYQSFTTVVGRTYRVTADIYVNTTNVRIGTSIGASDVSGSLNFPVGSRTFTFVATTTTTYLSTFPTNTSQTSEIDNVSVKAVSGNHALQSVNTGYRPLYKPNSGKPYELFDGSDDYQVTPFIPTAALTLACAVRFPAAGASSIFAIGGGNSTGNKRAFIGKVATTGTIAVGWGQETAGTYALGPDLGTTDHVLVLTGDGTSREIWLDGALIDSRAPLAGLGPDGTGGGVALGAYNSNGSVVGFAAARIYAALGMNRRATVSEIGTIMSKFRIAYQ